MKCARSKVAHDTRAGRRAGLFVAHFLLRTVRARKRICSIATPEEKQVMRFEKGQSQDARDGLITEVDLADRFIALCRSGA